MRFKPAKDGGDRIKFRKVRAIRLTQAWRIQLNEAAKEGQYWTSQGKRYDAFYLSISPLTKAIQPHSQFER